MKFAIEKAQEATQKEAERANMEVKLQQLNCTLVTEEVLNTVLHQPAQHDHNHQMNTTFIQDGHTSAGDGDSNGVSSSRVNGVASWPKTEARDVRQQSPSPPPESHFLEPFTSAAPRREKSRRLTRTTTELLNETSGNPCVG